MLAQFVGNLDYPSAAFLVAFSLGGTIIWSTWLTKRRNTLELHQQFELNKIREANTRELQIFQERGKQDLNLKKVEQGLITSHRVGSGGDSQ